MLVLFYVVFAARQRLIIPALLTLFLFREAAPLKTPFLPFGTLERFFPCLAVVRFPIEQLAPVMFAMVVVTPLPVTDDINGIGEEVITPPGPAHRYGKQRNSPLFVRYRL